MIRGVLFDFNGTLFYDSEMHIEAFYHCFDRYRCKNLTREEIAANIFGRSNRQIFLENYNPNGTDADIAEFDAWKEDDYRRICLNSPERLHFVEGAAEYLRELKARGIPFCIATGSPEKNVGFYRSILPLDEFFDEDHIVFDDGTVKGKPNPDLYLRAAKRIGVDPSECAVFEDGTSGIRAAHAAKAGRVVAIWEETIPSPLIQGVTADLCIHDYTNRRQLADLFGWEPMEEPERAHTGA